jgi:hypothetical protein
MMVAGPLGIELLPNTRSDSRNERLNFSILLYLMFAGFFDVEDLAPQRKDCLELPVPSSFGRTTC